MLLGRAGLRSERGYGGNGHKASGLPLTGYGDIGPTVVLVPGNRHWEEPAEGQWTPFSWAEFIAEEPAKPKGRGRKPKPAAASLFEWALALEQDREWEAEPVDAGR